MDKQHFLSLLYLLGVAPILFAVSSAISDTNTFFLFGILNIVLLLLFALIFSKISLQKKSIWLAVIGGILLLGVVWWGLYKLGNGASEWLYNQVLAPNTQENNTNEDTDTSLSGDMLSGDILSGDVLSWQTSPDVSLTGETTPDYIPSEPINEPQAPATDTFAPSEEPQAPTYTTALPSQGTLNYSQVIPYLVEQYSLKNTSGKSYNFANVSRSNILYTPFNIAASKAMIGENINPITKVSCNTYLVLKGIAAGWSVSYTGTPQPAYRAKAVELWQVNGCTDGAFVTKATL